MVCLDTTMLRQYEHENKNQNKKSLRLKIYKFFYKQGSTRQVKHLSNFSTGLKTDKQFENLYFQYLTGNVN